MTDFAAVDAGDAHDLVAMMDATDAWPAVQAAREWVLERAAPVVGALVVDVGCGPGTFGAAAAVSGATTVDVDVSLAMFREARRRGAVRSVLGDSAHLPLGTGRAQLGHAERVLQWTPDPSRAITELGRVVAAGGWIAVTDTDWGTFSVDHPDPAAATRLAGAALTWVPHARVARDLPTIVAALGTHDVRARHHTATITVWNPDDPMQHDGPPGLPLHSIAGAHAADLHVVAECARAGEFRAQVTLVTCTDQV